MWCGRAVGAGDSVRRVLAECGSVSHLGKGRWSRPTSGTTDNRLVNSSENKEEDLPAGDAEPLPGLKRAQTKSSDLYVLERSS